MQLVGEPNWEEEQRKYLEFAIKKESSCLQSKFICLMKIIAKKQ